MLVRETDSTVMRTLITVFVLVCLAAAIALGWFASRAFNRTEKVAETHTKAIRQDDGSLVLERKPVASAVLAMQIPKGSKVERVAQVTVKPKVAKNASNVAECDPVTVDLALVRMPDKTTHLIASSPDGTVVSGFDSPLHQTSYPVQYKRAIGADWVIGTRKVKPWIEQDVYRARVGVSVWEEGGKPAASIRVGWLF